MKQPYGKMKFRTPAIVRSVFIISSIVVITMSILSVFAWGFKDLKTASDNGVATTKVSCRQPCLA